MLFLLGLPENQTARIVLGDEYMVVVSNFGARRDPRGELLRVVAEKGCPLAVERCSGDWVRLPENMGSLHASALRAWLRNG